MTVLDEPLDGIAFAGGSVRPGDRVAFNVVITHNAPKAEFYVVQRHEQSIAGTIRRAVRMTESRLE